VEHGSTRVAPDELNVLGLQRFDQNLGPAQLVIGRSGGRSGCHFGFIDFHIFNLCEFL
jgi:hypothetical protein